MRHAGLFRGAAVEWERRVGTLDGHKYPRRGAHRFRTAGKVGVTVECTLQVGRLIPNPPVKVELWRGVDVAHEPVQGTVTCRGPFGDTRREVASGTKQVVPAHSRNVEDLHEHSRRDGLEYASALGFVLEPGFIDERRIRRPECLSVTAGKLEVPLDGGRKIVGHVVFDSPDVLSPLPNTEGSVLAAQTVGRFGGIIHLDVPANETPSFVKVGGRTGHLEIIHVNAEQELQLGVPKSRKPVGDRHEAGLA